MTNELIDVATQSGREAVDASTTANLAVHRALCGGDGEWAVSHRPTGCRMALLPTKRKAVALARMLERDHADDLLALADLGFAVRQRPTLQGRRKKAGDRLRTAIAKAVS